MLKVFYIIKPYIDAAKGIYISLFLLTELKHPGLKLKVNLQAQDQLLSGKHKIFEKNRMCDLL
jgi:hypothetical protein